MIRINWCSPGSACLIMMMRVRLIARVNLGWFYVHPMIIRMLLIIDFDDSMIEFDN